MVVSEHLKKYNTDEMLFFLAVIFKPLYLFPSGSFQIGDFLFIAAVAVHFFAGSERELLFPIHKEEHSLLIFVAGVLVINTIYWVLIGTADFLVNSSYYVFNFLIVLYIADLLQTERKDVFLHGLCIACKVVITFQLIVYITGSDTVDIEGRHLGTFNDPNQFAVYILFCLLIMFDIYHSIKIRELFWLVTGGWLIVASGSTGSLLGLAFFLALFLLISAVPVNRKRIAIGFTCIAVVCAALAVLRVSGNSAVSNDTINMISARFTRKLGNVNGLGDFFNTLINDRIWNRVFEQPKYLLYGSGEGAHSRFDASYLSHEIHSSILGPPFYYGIGIAFFMFRWIAIKLKHVDAFQFCIYIAMLAECLLLVNYRQPLFWLLFVLAGRDKSDSLMIRRKYESEDVDPVVIQKIN